MKFLKELKREVAGYLRSCILREQFITTRRQLRYLPDHEDGEVQHELTSDALIEGLQEARLESGEKFEYESLVLKVEAFMVSLEIVVL